jgi:hypothetical protein
MVPEIKKIRDYKSIFSKDCQGKLKTEQSEVKNIDSKISDSLLIYFLSKDWMIIAKRCTIMQSSFQMHIVLLSSSVRKVKRMGTSF